VAMPTFQLTESTVVTTATRGIYSVHLRIDNSSAVPHTRSGRSWIAIITVGEGPVGQLKAKGS
jgi:hypothetical protein